MNMNGDDKARQVWKPFILKISRKNINSLSLWSNGSDVLEEIIQKHVHYTHDPLRVITFPSHLFFEKKNINVIRY